MFSESSIDDKTTLRVTTMFPAPAPAKDAKVESCLDTEVTTLVLCMVRNPDEVVREVRRVLRPGGAFFFYEHVLSPRRRGRWWQNSAYRPPCFWSIPRSAE